MALKVIGGIALLLLLIQPAKADSTTLDNFTLGAPIGDLSFTMPATIPYTGNQLFTFEAYTPGPDEVIPWTIVFAGPISGGVYHEFYFCDAVFPITGPFYDFCDAEFNSTSPALPWTVTGGEMTFLLGSFGALTITADTPEPETLWLLGIGLLGVGLLGRHARRQMERARISSGFLESRASGGRFYRYDQRT